MEVDTQGQNKANPNVQLLPYDLFPSLNKTASQSLSTAFQLQSCRVHTASIHGYFNISFVKTNRTVVKLSNMTHRWAANQGNFALRKIYRDMLTLKRKLSNPLIEVSSRVNLGRLENRGHLLGFTQV